MRKNIKLRVKNLVEKYGTTDPYRLCHRMGIVIEYKNLGIRILRTDVGDMLEGRHAADVRTVLQVVLVPRTGTLHKGKRGGFLVVAGAENFALARAVVRGKPFHHHVGDDGRGGSVIQIGDLVGVVRIPTGRPDDGTHFQ